MKSHVSMEQHKCIVCTQDYDTGAILLDKRLRASMERNTVTAWGLCPEHAKLHEDGYIALVGADESKSDKLPDGNINPSGAYRTGQIIHIRASVFSEIFNIPAINTQTGKVHPMMFCEPAVIDLIRAKLS